MKRSCPYCGRVHNYSYVCPAKPKRSGKHDKNSIAYQMRKSGAWTKKSISIRQRDNYCCLYCFRIDKKITSDDLSVHHIDSIKTDPDRAFDDYNLITLCRYHHDMAEAKLIDKDVLFDMVYEQNEGFFGENIGDNYVF